MSCARHAHLDPQSEEYQMWKQSHLVDDKCTLDFDGSANAIEAAGAVELWSRSISQYNLRYTTLIGDDSKAYSAVVDSKPYGDVEIPNYLKEKWTGGICRSRKIMIRKN